MQHALHYFHNVCVDSNKVKPGVIQSPDLPDPRQAAVPVRTTRGRASKRDGTGQFVCCDMYMLVRHTTVASLTVDSNKTQKPCPTASPDLPDLRQAAVPVKTTRGCAFKRDGTGQFVCYDCLYNMHVICETLFA